MVYLSVNWLQLSLCAFLIGQWIASGQKEPRPFVNKRLKEHPVRLQPEHFRRGKMDPPPDQEPIISKILRKDLIEGDIVGYSKSIVRDAMSAKFRGYGIQRSAVRDRYNLWPNRKIPFVVSSNYYDLAKYKLAAALADFHQNSCIRFVPRTDEEDYLYIRPDDGCYSSVGRTGGQQTVSLDEGCFQHGTIVHELMHTLGIFHEQNRNDRDSYVSIRWENIEPGLENNFQKRDLATIDNMGTPYDYTSVMHYGDDYFSRNGLPTVIPFKSGVKIGQRDGFSFYDVRRINLLYQCDKRLPEPNLPPPEGESPAPPDSIPFLPPTSPDHFRPPFPTIPEGPLEQNEGGVCFRKIPGATILVKIKRGCFRVVKFNGRITVASCDWRAQSTKLSTDKQEEAREEARYLQSLGLIQCYSEGLRERVSFDQRSNNWSRNNSSETDDRRPEIYHHLTEVVPDWRFDRFRDPHVGERRQNLRHSTTEQEPNIRPFDGQRSVRSRPRSSRNRPNNVRPNNRIMPRPNRMIIEGRSGSSAASYQQRRGRSQ